MTSGGPATWTCGLCGHRFAAGGAGCNACPLHPGCQMLCCPACGYTMPDPGRSRLARWLGRWQNGRSRPAANSNGAGAPLTLADIPPGACARVLSLAPCPAARCERLQAYGLSPGHCVRVVQHRPVTVVRVDNTELALERELARGVVVEAVA